MPVTVAHINERKQERASLITQAQEVADRARSEKRNMTPEDEAQFDNLMDKADDLQGTIEREQRELDAVRSASAMQPTAIVDEAELKPEEVSKRAYRSLILGRADASEVVQQATQALRQAYNGQGAIAQNMGISGQNAEALFGHRALSGETGGTGGFLIPEAQSNDIITELKNSLWIAGAAKIYNTSARSVGIPALEADPGDSEWTGEVSKIPEDDQMKYGKRRLTAHPLAKRLKISVDELMDSPEVENIVRDRLNYKMQVTGEKAYLTGDGVNKPLGLFTVSDDGIGSDRDVSADNEATEVTVDGLVNAKYEVREAYHGTGCVWIFHRYGMRNLIKLKDDEGRPLLQLSYREGESDRILGHPVRTSEYAPSDFTTGKIVGLFGNLMYYGINFAPAKSLQRLDELYAETSEVGFITRMRGDGMPMLAEAFSRVKLG